MGTPGTIQAAVVDIHAEATSEKLALGHSFDGRASLVIGTHTHVPTADHQVLEGGTAYMTFTVELADATRLAAVLRAGAVVVESSAGRRSSAWIAATGQTVSHSPQSMHSSGWM